MKATISKLLPSLSAFLAGMSLVLAFAPFHLPGVSLMSIACLFILIERSVARASFFTGFSFGLGFFGLGISWVFISIRNYGHLPTLLSAGITSLFIAYLALYPALMAYAYQLIKPRQSRWLAAWVFSSVWCVSESLRATVFGGFPWLMLGYGQFDSPLGHLLPVVGVLGVSWITCFLGVLLALAFTSPATTRGLYLLACVVLLIAPVGIAHRQWSQADTKHLTVGIIQANLSMRDKWDERLFWRILTHYRQAVHSLLAQDIIVLPESAIPLPSYYVKDYLMQLNNQAKQYHSGILLGIPQESQQDNRLFYNALLGLGEAHGSYQKQHLVAFGEFIPAFFTRLTDWLNLPTPNMVQGTSKQPLMTIHDRAFATLICYELAYPELLRQQLPTAEWIVSISDDGWFGHSLAIYQHLQMAQVLSKQSARYQIVANNDGLSSVLNTNGEIIASLPAFNSGTLRSALQPSHGETPWVQYGEQPIYGLMLIVLLSSISISFIYRRQSNKPSCCEPQEAVS